MAKKNGIKVLSFMNPPGYKLGDGKWGFNTPQGFQPSQVNNMYKVSDVNFDIIHVQHKPIAERIFKMYPEIVKVAGTEFSPAIIANYAFELVKLFNHFYQTVPILIEKEELVKNLRLALCEVVSDIINRSLNLLGIDSPEKM
jgi:arginyl-tRNA synthetase